MKNKINKSFTLIEVVVVMAVMGLIMGGLLMSMRQIIESEMLLKGMQAVEGESRFIMELFAMDAQYSELDPSYDPGNPYAISFALTEKIEDLLQESGKKTVFSSFEKDTAAGKEYYLTRRIMGSTENIVVTLNSTPLHRKPIFWVRKVTAEGNENFITLSLVFKVKKKDSFVLVPIQTSIVSRTFEM